MWRTYLPLWGGAVLAGLIVGAGPNLLRSTPTNRGDIHPKMAVQTALEAKPAAEHQEWASRADDNTAASAVVTAIFGFCHTGAGTNCVVDGDTIWFQGEKVRVADIDAPETHEYHCPEEKALGDRATQRLIQLVNSGPVTLRPIDRDEDVYGRKLRIVLVSGVSVGDMLVGEGLARYYESGRKPWC